MDDELRRARLAVFGFDGDRISNERAHLDSASLLRRIGRGDAPALAGVEGFAAAPMKGERR